jgi:hypothetical protein
MSKIVVLYWEPGSCGDFVHSTMLAQHEEYHGMLNRFQIDANGRAVPGVVLSFFRENFSCTDNLWYEITWDQVNIDKLSAYMNEHHIQQFVIPTHRYTQVTAIKELITDTISVGITYPSNMFPLILKNWCKKVAAKDKVLQKMYNKPLHQNLINNELFGEYILTEQLKFGSNIPTSVDHDFDINISLEELFNQDLTSVKSLFVNSNHVDSMFNGWFKQQSILHKYHYSMPSELKKSLGFNSLAVVKGSLDIELDTFDNILINHHAGLNQNTKFKTLNQAINFFKYHENR